MLKQKENYISCSVEGIWMGNQWDFFGVVIYFLPYSDIRVTRDKVVKRTSFLSFMDCWSIGLRKKKYVLCSAFSSILCLVLCFARVVCHLIHFCEETVTAKGLDVAITMYSVSFRHAKDNGDGGTVEMAEQEAYRGGQEIGSTSRNKSSWSSQREILSHGLKDSRNSSGVLERNLELASPKYPLKAIYQRCYQHYTDAHQERWQILQMLEQIAISYLFQTYPQGKVYY